MANPQSEKQPEPFSVRISSLLWADILVLYAFFVMQNYLTDVWGLSFTHAAGIVNIYGGACLILPVFFLWLVDAFLGHFWMLLLSSIAYSVGIVLVAISTPPFFGPCKVYEARCIGDTQKLIFYVGMPLVAIGVAGHEVSVKTFIKENKGLSGKTLLKMLGAVPVAIIPVVGAIALPHIKPWAVRFGIPAICTALTTLLFLICSPCFVKKRGEGSPITSVFRVFVACARNMFKKDPPDEKGYYKKNQSVSFKNTRFLSCLHKAAIDGDNQNQWKVCPVEEVEEAKIAVRMIPMWITFIICGIVSSTGSTYFVEQANHMNRKLGTWNVPAPVLLFFHQQSKTIIGTTLVKPFLFKGPKQGKYASAVGIAMAIVCSTLCCIVAALIETKRLNTMRSHGLSDVDVKEIPMSVFWLLFQYFLLAGLDAFLGKSVDEFYKYQSPESMKEYPRYFAKWVSGIGYLCNVLLVYGVRKISETGGRTSWFKFTLNKSHLDRYYWVLAALSAANLVIFALVASLYRYKDHGAEDGQDGTGNTPIDDGDGCIWF